MNIRKISTEDWKNLQEIGRKTFEQTFSESNTEEDMKKYLNESFSEEKLKQELSNPYSEFYFAENEGKVLGYLKINFSEAQTEIKEENSLEIERIYVLKEYHGKKVGQILYEKALQLAISKEKEILWLGVWEKNERAIRFYEKNGFVAFDKHIFILGEDEQIDIMMKKDIFPYLQ